jgi:hypothetical protein
MFDSDLPFPQAISAFADCSEATAAIFQEAGAIHQLGVVIFQEAGAIPDCRATNF